MVKPLISVVILTWNRKQDLLRSIGSVYRQEYPAVEVVLIDNNSTDGTKEAVLSAYPDIKYIKLPYNLGVIGGRNVGIANATGDIILLLDDDAEFLDKDAFLRIASRFATEPELAVLFFRYLLEDGEDWGWTLPFRPQPEWRELEIYTHTFVGCAHCIRRVWIEKVGYLKREFFREGEEADYAYRIIAQGGRILYYPAVKVLHRLNPHQRIYAEHQAYKLAHRTENDLLYMALTDAMATLLWRLGFSLYKAVKEGWIGGYLLGCWRLLKAMPRIMRERRPLDTQTMRMFRTLMSYVVLDIEVARYQRTSLLDYIRVRLTGKPKGILNDKMQNESTSRS